MHNLKVQYGMGRQGNFEFFLKRLLKLYGLLQF